MDYGSCDFEGIIQTFENTCPLRALVVEDEAIIAMDESCCLENLGMTVSGVAGNSVDAVRMAQELQPDFILMDIDLGESIDGITVMERIREHHTVNVVFVTGHIADDARIQNASRLPHTWVLKKPFNEAQLQQILTEIRSGPESSDLMNHCVLIA